MFYLYIYILVCKSGQNELKCSHLSKFVVLRVSLLPSLASSHCHDTSLKSQVQPKQICNLHKISQNNILLTPILSGWRRLELEVQKKKGLSFLGWPWKSQVPTFGFQSQNEHGATEPGRARGEAHGTCLLAKDLVGIDGSSLPWRPIGGHGR